MVITQLPPSSSKSQMNWGTCQYVPQNNFRVLESGDWVSLLALPSEYAQDRALLLCELDEEYWLTWIPNHGEAKLCLRQFCSLVT